MIASFVGNECLPLKKLASGLKMSSSLAPTSLMSSKLLTATARMGPSQMPKMGPYFWCIFLKPSLKLVPMESESPKKGKLHCGCGG